MLTNFLPGLGNGTFTLYAIADDGDGHWTISGLEDDHLRQQRRDGAVRRDRHARAGGNGDHGDAEQLRLGAVAREPQGVDPPDGGTVRDA